MRGGGAYLREPRASGGSQPEAEVGNEDGGGGRDGVDDGVERRCVLAANLQVVDLAVVFKTTTTTTTAAPAL